MSESELPPPNRGGRPRLTEAQKLHAAKELARRRLWNKGILSWKFNDYPWAKDLYTFIRNGWGGPPLSVQMHRRGGKSTTCMIVGVEECLRNPHITVGILCTSKEQARDIGDESLAAILEDCPKNIYPRKIKNDFTWVFDHNGSKIVILPADKLSAKSGRGRKFRFLHVLEAAFIPNLRRIIRSILGPTLLDVRGKSTGQMVLESTPPDETVAADDVAFWEETWTEARAEARSFFLPLSQNTQASPLFVEACKKQAGGEHTEEYLREYELKSDLKGSRTAVPEFSDNEKDIVREVPRPDGSDRYASLDPGGLHPTGILWGHYNFEEDLLVIEDEWLTEGATTDVIVATTKEKESSLWGEAPKGKILRVADNNNPILLRDLHRDGITFHPTAKDDKDAQINRTRVMFRDGRIAIHPRCLVLIKTLRIAKRAKSKRKGFDEAEGIGHADLLDCLLYMVRNVRKHELPEEVQEFQGVRGVIPSPPPAPRPNAARQLSKHVFTGLRPQLRSGLRRW